MSIKDTKPRKNKDFKRKIKTLEKKWEDIGVHSYQRWGTRLLRSVELICRVGEKHDCSKSHLLDIGCYNGVLGIIAAEYFQTVVGIDKHKSRMKSAKLSAREFKVGDHCKFKALFLSEYIKEGYFEKHNIDSVMAFQVLYHLSTKEINMLRKRFRNKVQLAILGTRPNKDYTNNKYDLRSVNSVLKTLVKPYFKKWDVYYEGTVWPTIVAIKG